MTKHEEMIENRLLSLVEMAVAGKRKPADVWRAIDEKADVEPNAVVRPYEAMTAAGFRKPKKRNR